MNIYFIIFQNILFLILDVYCLEFLYTNDFTQSINCNSLFQNGWSPINMIWQNNDNCSYKCKVNSQQILMFAPDIKSYSLGIKFITGKPSKYYSYIYVDILYFQTDKDISIKLFENSISTSLIEKVLVNGSFEAAVQEMGYGAVCESSHYTTSQIPIMKSTLMIKYKLQPTNSLVFSLFQEVKFTNSQWYGIFNIRVYTNCVPNCLDCQSDTSCSKCVYGFDMIIINGNNICAQTGAVCQKINQYCQTCFISDQNSQCSTCLPGYTFNLQNICAPNPNSITCGGYYSACEDSCRGYSTTCFKNDPPGQFDLWITCPQPSKYKCPSNKQIMIYQFNNYDTYTCGCIIPYCESCSHNQGCDKCILGYEYNYSSKVCDFKGCPQNYNKDSNSQKCISQQKDVNKELMLINSSTQNCSKCYNSNCKQCIDEGPFSCKICNSGYQMYKGDCVASCPIKFFPSSQNQCYSCFDPNCDQCDQISYECTKCNSQTYLSKGKCILNCPKNQVDENRACFDCADPINCLSCSSNKSNACKKCTSSTVLREGVCVSSCGQYYFEKSLDNGVSRTCEKCYDSANCKICLDKDQNSCTLCSDNTYLDDGRCVTQCINNQLNTNTKKCFKCKDVNCDKCTDDGDYSCNKCKNNKYLDKNGQCVEQCPQNQFDQDNKCFECSDQVYCLRCSNNLLGSCTDCKQNSTINGGICKPNCLEGQYQLPDKSCQSCFNSLKCKSCKDQTKNGCTKCDPQMFLEDGQCVSQCQSGQYDEQKNCYKCNDSNCTVCTNSLQNSCTKCNGSTYLQKGSCVVKCDKDLFNLNNRECFECFDKNCEKCSSSANGGCKKCINEYFLNNEGFCTKYCFQNQFDHKEGKCYDCFDISNCQYCKSQEEGACQKCSNDKVEKNGKCVKESECGEGYYIEINNQNLKTCKKCNTYLYKGKCIDQCDQYDSNMNCIKCFESSCIQCNDNNDKSCLACDNGKKLMNGQCKDRCSKNYYTVTDQYGKMNCEQCVNQANYFNQNICLECLNLQNCEQCNGNGFCQKCENGWKLKNGECVKDCGQSYIEIRNKDSQITCELCSGGEKCSKCSSINPDSCLVCSQYYYNFQSNCLKQCPEGYGPGQGENINKCVSCYDENCQQCNQLYSNCSSCKMYYTLEDNICILSYDIDYTLTQYSGDVNEFVIEFSKAIDNLELLVQDLLVIHLKIQEAYEEEYTYQYHVIDDKKIIVQFNFTKPYAGDTIVQVEFKQNSLRYSCNKPVQEIDVQFRQNVDTTTLAATQAISKANAAASTVAVSSVLPLAFSGQFAFIATVVDITEILQLMAFTQILQPWNSQIVYDSFAKFNVPFWNMFSHIKNYDKMNDEPPGKFNVDSDTSATFIRQAGEHFTITLICVFLNGLNCFLLHALRNKQKPLKILKQLNKLINPIRLSTEVLWTVYYDICLGFFLQLTSMNSDLKYPLEGVNYTVTFISISVIILPFIVAYWMKKGRFHQITEAFTEGLSSKYFWLFFYLRRFYCVFVIVIFQKSGYAQITLLTLFHLLHLILSLKLKPYEDRLQNIRNLLQAILIIVGTVMMYPLVDYGKYNDEQQVNFGWATCGPFIAIVGIELLFFVAQVIYSIYQLMVKTYKFIKQRKQVQPFGKISSPDQMMNTKGYNHSNKIDEVDGDDKYCNYPQVQRQKTEDIMLRTNKDDDPLARLQTNMDDYKTKQYSTNSIGTRFTLQTEESVQVSPKKISNFELLSPHTETNILFTSQRKQLWVSPKSGGKYKNQVQVFSISEVELEEEDKQKNSDIKQDNIKKKTNNQNMSQFTSSQIQDDSQISPIKLEGSRLMQSSMQRLNNPQSINNIKSLENLQRDKEKSKTIILKRIEAEENEDETPQHNQQSNLFSPNYQAILPGESKIYMMQKGLDSQVSIEQPKIFKNNPKLRRKTSRLQTILRMNRNLSDKRNSESDNLNADIQTITINEDKYD